ncbi:hypothetical protein [Polaribacter sp. Z022]|uniref:hypothetical protein n=1 Tax=Polaribacter sp. Z022 TaxID=2927125 RepID=UPI0020220319|nr:hypothetical protein [Polaribacter sp. Z022]MCL7752556.1 hypothetical protein [Polaribacter sp. Z022]
MKKIILLIILFCAFSAQAQYGYGNGRNQRQRQMPQTQPKAQDPDFPIEKYLGIVKYDIKKAAKKSSIKLSSKEGKEFSKILTTYNKDIKDITRINSFLIKSTKQMVDNFQKSAMASGDFSNQAKIRKKMIENLLPLSTILKEEDTKLDKSIKGLLSEKQYKKWIKYNKKLYKVFPKETK